MLYHIEILILQKGDCHFLGAGVIRLVTVLGFKEVLFIPCCLIVLSVDASKRLGASLRLNLNFH